jgi:hypothetical protein
VNEAKRLKELEEENRKLKHVVADLTLDNRALKDIASKKSNACGSPTCGWLSTSSSRSLGWAKAGAGGGIRSDQSDNNLMARDFRP